MVKGYYTYRIRVANRDRVQVEKLDASHQEQGQPSGRLRYQEKLSEITPLLQAAKNNELNDPEQTRSLGEALFEILFDDVLRQDFVNCYYQVVQQEKQLLRVELDIDEQRMPDIAALPWEFMRVPEYNIWIGTAPKLVVSRRRSQWLPAQPIPLAPNEKLRIALVIATPSNLSPVAYEPVQAALEQLAQDQEQIELLPIVNSANPEEIDAILSQEPHIFHFIGHGRMKNESDKEIGEIALVDPDFNEAMWVDADDFSELFNQHRSGVVMLQACEGGTLSSSQAFVGVASRIVQKNVPVVVAMQYEVTNSTASRFARKFYTQLETEDTVDIAAQLGRRAIALGPTQYKKRDFATPVIFMRVQDGHVFQRESDQSDIESNQLPNQGKNINQNVQQSGKSNINIGQANDIYYIVDTEQNELLATIAEKFEETTAGINDERHRRVDYARTLINEGNFIQAVQYLEELKTELWYQVDSTIKYRLLANLGLAKLGLDEIQDASTQLIRALQYNPDDDSAIAYAAMGHVFHKNYDKAKELIKKALQINPANTLAYSLYARIAPISESIESVLEQIPSQYRNDLHVLVALGEAALRREKYEKAAQYWENALTIENSRVMDSVKVALGAALIEPITYNYSLIVAGQLLDSQKQRLERAINLFTEVLGSEYVNPNDLSRLQLTALTNRAAARRLLSQKDKAILDLEIAHQKELNDPYLIKQRALLAYEKGNLTEAFSYIEQILSSPETPEALLLAATFLIELDDFQKAQEILNQFLDSSNCNDHDLKQEARRIKFDLFLEDNDHQNAEKILQEISDQEPDSAPTLIYRIKWAKYKDSDQNISQLVKQIKKVLNSHSSISDYIIVANYLYSLNYYQDAAENYEKFVDININSQLSQNLLWCYYLGGNYKDALNLSQQLIDKYGPLEGVSEIAAYIYENIGDTDTARQICEDYLNVFPNDVGVKLRLAILHYSLGEYENLDRFLDSQPILDCLNLDSYKRLAQLYKFRNRINRFMEVIYEARARFYNNEEVHEFYQISYFEATQFQTVFEEFQSVKDGCGILLRNEFGKEKWYIIEDQKNADFGRGELNFNQQLYQALINKGVGEEICQGEDSFGRHILEILAITDKYYAAAKLSLLILENQTNFKNFKMVYAPIEDNGEKGFSDWTEKLINELQKYQKHFEKIKSAYISGKLPFGSAAAILNRNPIQLWQILAFGPSPFIHAWSNFKYEKFGDALITLQKGGMLIIDPISLVTLHYLGIADDILRVQGELGIAQSTIDCLKARLEQTEGFEKEGFLTFSVENGQGIKQEVTPEQVAQQKAFFEKIIDWVRKNCRVLSCYRALDINSSERNQLNEYIGTAFVDTILIAQEPGRILYSDDQWLRWYAYQTSRISGVWTQVVIKYCLTEKMSNTSLYHKASLQLAIQGYTHTIIDAEILMEAVRLSNWQITRDLTLALETLVNKHSLEGAISIGVNFLHKLYLDREIVIPNSQLNNPNDDILLALLKAFESKYQRSNFIQRFVQDIKAEFRLMPIQKLKILELIKAWLSLTGRNLR